MKAFLEFNDSVAGEGALPARTKKPVMIGTSVAIRCEPCIRAHGAGARVIGIRREKILETAGVAVLMGGGPAAA